MKPKPITAAPMLPENFLRCMSKADRAALGKAGMTAAEAIAAKEAADEGELQNLCATLLALRGIAFIRPPMHRKSQLPKGWPDFTFAYLGKPCAWECKTSEGTLKQEQIECIARMQSPPNHWRVAIIRSAAEAKDFLDDQNLTF